MGGSWRVYVPRQQNAITPILQFSKPFCISCCKKIHICLNFLLKEMSWRKTFK